MNSIRTLSTALFTFLMLVGVQAHASPITMDFDGTGVTGGAGSNSTHLEVSGNYYREDGMQMTLTGSGHVHVHGSGIAVDHSQQLTFNLVSNAVFNLTRIHLTYNNAGVTLVGSNGSTTTLTGTGNHTFGSAWAGITSFTYASIGNSNINTVEINASVPEPATLTLLGLGLAGLGARRRSRKQLSA